jgi:uncharacterized protein YwqG
MNTLQELQEWLSTSVLSRISKEIMRVALPSIRLLSRPVGETQIRLGHTRLGGVPDLPQGIRWPEYDGVPLPFIAQINLSEVASYDTQHRLPSTGMLYFFFDLDAYFERGRVHQARIWRVLYIPVPFSDLHRLAIPEGMPKRYTYRLNEVICRAEITLPGYSVYEATSLERLGISEFLTQEEEQAYYQLQEQLAGTGGSNHSAIHRLLGHPDELQADMHEELGGRPDDWQLLFQVDSDGALGTEWGDTGRIYYWIQTHALAERNFNQVQVILQC